MDEIDRYIDSQEWALRELGMGPAQALAVACALGRWAYEWQTSRQEIPGRKSQLGVSILRDGALDAIALVTCGGWAHAYDPDGLPAG